MDREEAQALIRRLARDGRVDITTIVAASTGRDAPIGFIESLEILKEFEVELPLTPERVHGVGPGPDGRRYKLWLRLDLTQRQQCLKVLDWKVLP